MASERTSAAVLDRSAAPPAGPLRPFHFPAVHRRRLSNGIWVLVAEVNAFPVVSATVVVEAGATREPPQLAGVAALTAGLLESGAGNWSAEEIAEAIEALGVHLDSGASWDTAHVGLTALKTRFAPAADILADLIQRPSFPQSEVERLRAERLAEIVQRRADPRGLAGEAAARFIYSPDTPFARPLGGTPATVEGLTRQDAEAFHATHFTPFGAHIILVGDVDASAAIEMLEARFGSWVGGTTPSPQTDVRPRGRAPQVVVVHRPGAVQSEIRIGHIGLDRRAPDFFAVVVMNAILGGMFSSRLNLNLRERHGYTYGASSAFSMRRQPGAFLVSTAVQTEVTVPAIVEIVRELRGIREAPVTDAELLDARNYLAGVFPLRLQTVDGIAGRLAELVVYGLPDDYFESYRDHILAVTPDDVLDAATRRIRPDELAIVIAGDAERLRSDLEVLQIAPVRVIGPDEIESAA